MQDADAPAEETAAPASVGESSGPPGGALTLRKIKLTNYRGIPELELTVGATTVLIGENNVGKTTVLAALDAALGQRTWRRGPAFGDYDHHRPSPDPELPDGHRLEISATFHEDTPDEWNDDVSAARDSSQEEGGDRGRALGIRRRAVERRDAAHERQPLPEPREDRTGQEERQRTRVEGEHDRRQRGRHGREPEPDRRLIA